MHPTITPHFLHLLIRFMFVPVYPRHIDTRLGDLDMDATLIEMKIPVVWFVLNIFI